MPINSKSSNRLQTNQLMRWVILACLPALGTHWYCFGWGTPLQVLLASASALLGEASVMLLRGRPVAATLADGSALLTGVLLGLSLPPLAPWWIAVIGALFAIIIAKQLYGGLGHNLFNPAMVGYVVLLTAFPLPMSRWLAPTTQHSVTATLTSGWAAIIQREGAHCSIPNSDTVTQITPLDCRKTDRIIVDDAASSIPVSHWQQLARSGWLAINLSFLLGGLLLLTKRVIQWHIPLAVLSSLLLCATLGWWWQPLANGTPHEHLLSGATFFGAFFIATDPVTAATTLVGRLIFGGLIGLLIYLIRVIGGYPDGVAFAILIANMIVPLLDRYTQPRVYGRE